MFENFSDSIHLQMDKGGASVNYPPCFDVSKMKQEHETEWFREQANQPALKTEVELDIKTEPELLMREKVGTGVKSEYLMEFEDEKIGSQVAISEVFTMRVNAAQTSSETSDVRQDFKKPKKRITKDNLRLHTNINAGVKLFTCKVCNYRTWKKLNMKMHKATHIEKKPLARGRSDSRTSNHSALENHVQTHTVNREAGEKPFACDICNFRTSYKSSLIGHKRTHTGEKPFKCDVCDYRAAQDYTLNVHMRIHTGEKPYKCDVCDYRSAQQSALTIHIRTHNGEKPFKCAACDYRATHRSALIVHMRTHNGERPFKCDVCDYRSTQQSALKTHKEIHRGKKQFALGCQGYQASTNSAFEKHLKTSTERKPFVCTVCGYRSSQLSALKSHKAIHVGKKQFARGCQDYQASNNSALEKHVKTSTGRKPFVCHVCNYLTMWKTNMEKHVRTHTGEKPYKCDVCDYRSTQQSALNVHLRTHTERKRFECSECGYKTSYKANLMLHKKRRHTDQKPVCNIIKNGRGHRKCTGGPVDPRSDQPIKLINDEMHGPIDPTQDEMDQLIEPSVHEDTDLPTRMSNHPPCPVCLKSEAKMYSFCCKNCMLFWDYWKEGTTPPDCPGHRTEGEDAYCSGCRWGRYKMAALAWEAQMKKTTEPAKDLGLEELAASARDGADCNPIPANHPPCPICLKSEAKVFKFCCEECRLFWNRMERGIAKPPDCPGHVSEGEDADCSGCRRRRYEIAFLNAYPGEPLTVPPVTKQGHELMKYLEEGSSNAVSETFTDSHNCIRVVKISDLEH